MSKYIKIICLICLIICICLNLSMILCGCSENTSSENTSNDIEEFSEQYSEKVYVYIDPETRVNYLIYDGYYKSGITVRYNQDGSIMVTSKSEEEE